MYTLLKISLNTKSKLILSGLLAVLVGSPIASIIVYVTDSLAPLALIAVLWLMIYLVADKVVTIVAGALVKLLGLGSRVLGLETMESVLDEDDEEEEDEEEYDYEAMEDKAFIVWALIKTIHDEIAGKRTGKSIYMAIMDAGIPIDVYPYPRDASEEEKLETELDIEMVDIDAKMSLDGRRIIVFVPIRDFASILEMAERGGNERIVVRTREEAEVIFKLARSIAGLYSGGSKGLTLYLAFKSLVQLRIKGLIEISDEFIDSLAFAEGEVGNIVKRQVLEELGLSSKRKR